MRSQCLFVLDQLVVSTIMFAPQLLHTLQIDELKWLAQERNAFQHRCDDVPYYHRCRV